MSLPGFTAEAALHKISKSYHITGASVISAAQVVPAMPCCSARDYACDKCADCLDGAHPNRCRSICHSCGGSCSERC